MRRILLDTHAYIWWLCGSTLLGKKAVDLIQNGENEIFVSAASIWEIAIKQSIGKLEVPDGIVEAVNEEGFVELPISAFHGYQAGRLPWCHKDPFDRMLVAQAQTEGLEIMTNDAILKRYHVRTIEPQT